MTAAVGVTMSMATTAEETQSLCRPLITHLEQLDVDYKQQRCHCAKTVTRI